MTTIKHQIQGTVGHKPNQVSTSPQAKQQHAHAPTSAGHKPQQTDTFTISAQAQALLNQNHGGANSFTPHTDDETTYAQILQRPPLSEDGFIARLTNLRDISSLQTNIGTTENPLYVLTVGENVWVSRTGGNSREYFERLTDETDLSGIDQETLDKLNALGELARTTGASIAVPRLTNGGEIADNAETIEQTARLFYEHLRELNLTDAPLLHDGFRVMMGQQFTDILRRHFAFTDTPITPGQVTHAREQAQAFADAFLAGLADANAEFDTIFANAWSVLQSNEG